MHAIETLHAYAFVTRWGDSDIYNTHRLVHLATKVWLGGQDAMKGLNEEVAAHLVEIFPSDDYSNRAIWQGYFPHAYIKARHDLCMAVARCLRVDLSTLVGSTHQRAALRK